MAHGGKWDPKSTRRKASFGTPGKFIKLQGEFLRNEKMSLVWSENIALTIRKTCRDIGNSTGGFYILLSLPSGYSG